MTDVKFIGLTGVATCGKDTFYRYATRYVNLQTDVPYRAQCQFPLGARIRHDLCDLINTQFGIYPDRTTQAQKELIRPMLVAYSNTKRKQSNGRYFWKCAQTQIVDNALRFPNTPFTAWVTDIRFAEYPIDEVDWLQDICDGVLIHITRLSDVGEPIVPANEFEATNDPKLKVRANYHFVWGDETVESGYAKVAAFMEANREIWS